MGRKRKRLEPIHPGEILSEEFMKPMGITQYRLAKDLSVKPLRVSEIVREKRGISADTALRLGRYCGLSWTGFLRIHRANDGASSVVIKFRIPPLRAAAGPKPE